MLETSKMTVLIFINPKKIYAAYEKALQSKEKPTVILIKTVKGDGMGEMAQGRNTAHQKDRKSVV